MLDFAPPAGLGTVALAAPLSDIAGWLFPTVLLVLAPRLRMGAVEPHQIRRTRVGVDGGGVVIANVLRSYRIPRKAITDVVTRRAWFGGVYAECFGLRVSSRWRYLSFRSIPMHALSGGGAAAHELHELLAEASPEASRSTSVPTERGGDGPDPA